MLKQFHTDAVDYHNSGSACFPFSLRITCYLQVCVPQEQTGAVEGGQPQGVSNGGCVA
jgi:hypothetical protein